MKCETNFNDLFDRWQAAAATSVQFGEIVQQLVITSVYPSKGLEADS